MQQAGASAWKMLSANDIVPRPSEAGRGAISLLIKHVCGSEGSRAGASGRSEPVDEKERNKTRWTKMEGKGRAAEWRTSRGDAAATAPSSARSGRNPLARVYF